MAATLARHAVEDLRHGFAPVSIAPSTQDVVVNRLPVPSSFQTPAVNKITNQVHIVRLELIEQAVKGRGVGIAITEMYIADKQRAYVTATVRLVVHNGRPRGLVAGGNDGNVVRFAVVAHFLKPNT